MRTAITFVLSLLLALSAMAENLNNKNEMMPIVTVGMEVSFQEDSVQADAARSFNSLVGLLQTDQNKSRAFSSDEHLLFDQVLRQIRPALISATGVPVTARDAAIALHAQLGSYTAGVDLAKQEIAKKALKHAATLVVALRHIPTTPPALVAAR